MARVFVRPARTLAEHQAAHALVEATYQYLGYITGRLPALTDPATVLLCFRDGQLVGTGTLLAQAAAAPTSTETEFGYDLAPLLPPDIERRQLVEIKRFAKRVAPTEPGADAVLLALMLATTRYALGCGQRAWVATLKPDLLRTFGRLALPLRELACRPVLPHCLRLLDGSYYADPVLPPRSVYCDLTATARQLRRFEVLLDRGSIVLDASLSPSVAELA